MNIARAMAKMATLPRILEAAQLLHSEGVLAEQPNETVKRYVLANPEINELLAMQGKEATPNAQVTGGPLAARPVSEANES